MDQFVRNIITKLIRHVQQPDSTVFTIICTSDGFNIFDFGPGLVSDSSGFQNTELGLVGFRKPVFSEALTKTQ